MHVLLIHQAYAGPDDPGGTRHYELATYCAQQDHRFTIVASDVNYKTGQKVGSPSTSASTDAVRVLRARTPAGLHLSVFRRLVAFIGFATSSFVTALRVPGVDVYMGTSPPMFQAPSAWLVAAMRRRPFVLEVRDLWPDSLIQGGVLKSRLATGAFLVLERFLYGRAVRIIVNSPAYEDYLVMHKHVDRDRITVIPNGVDTAMFDPAADGADFREAHNLKGKFIVVYAGAISVANDIPVIIDTADKLRDYPDIVFVLVGDGNTRSKCERMVAERGLANVIFAGAQPKSAVPGILAAADVCLATLKPNPIYANVYPNKVFDYMAAGRPIVLSIDGVIRQVVESAGAGMYVRPGDASALAEAVIRLRGDSSLRTEMGRSGRRCVEESFERKHQAEAFEGTLRGVCDAWRDAPNLDDR